MAYLRSRQYPDQATIHRPIGNIFSLFSEGVLRPRGRSILGALVDWNREQGREGRTTI